MKTLSTATSRAHLLPNTYRGTSARSDTTGAGISLSRVTSRAVQYRQIAQQNFNQYLQEEEEFNVDSNEV